MGIKVSAANRRPGPQEAERGRKAAKQDRKTRKRKEKNAPDPAKEKQTPAARDSDMSMFASSTRHTCLPSHARHAIGVPDSNLPVPGPVPRLIADHPYSTQPLHVRTQPAVY